LGEYDRRTEHEAHETDESVRLVCSNPFLGFDGCGIGTGMFGWNAEDGFTAFSNARILISLAAVGVESQVHTLLGME
jgi:hypothetical protein